MEGCVRAMTGTEGQARKLCIDLCSGLGGFSQAFIDAGWDVVRVDNESKFNPTVCADITEIDWNEFRISVLGGRTPDLLLASPPCERFSIACRTWPKVGIKKAMQIVGACFEAVGVLRPSYWMIENPMGRLRWFLGKPGQTLRLVDYGAPYEKKTDLWSNFVLPLVQGRKEAEFWVYKEGHFNAKQAKPEYSPKYSPIALPGKGKGKALCALMPYGLSQAILEAVSQS